MIVEKHCKHCNVRFEFTYEPVGKGSGNALRKTYCGNACQIEARLAAKKKPYATRFQKSCEVCSNTFYVPKSLLARKTCSNACRFKRHSKISIGETLEKVCQTCGKCFQTQIRRRKYCSPTCSSEGQMNRTTTQCEICNVTVTSKKSYEPRFCSKTCQREAQSRGMIATHVNGRSGFRNDIENSPYFKSSYEADYYRYCAFTGMKLPKYECKSFHLTVNGKPKCYTPDFWHEDEKRYVELKGVKRGKSKFSVLVNSNVDSVNEVISLGENVEIIYMNDFYRRLREENLYDSIPNLENRDYAGTVHLIRKRSQDQLD